MSVNSNLHQKEHFISERKIIIWELSTEFQPNLFPSFIILSMMQSFVFQNGHLFKIDMLHLHQHFFSEGQKPPPRDILTPSQYGKCLYISAPHCNK